MRHRAIDMGSIDTGEMGYDFRRDGCLGVLMIFARKAERTLFPKRLPNVIGPSCRQ
jgi:hypothetical protein